MRTTVAVLACTAALAAAVPTAIDYTPKGGWESVDYSKVDYSNVDWNKVDYSKVDYGKVDWSKVDYTKVDYSKIDWSKVKYPAPGHPSYPAPASSQSPACTLASYHVESPFHFTSYYEVKATPQQVVNGTTPTGGLTGASGLYKLAINAPNNVICFNITLYNFDDSYQSPATTATHIHEATFGQSGPPRIAFPNPTEIGNGLRRSIGCLTGPFNTGIPGANGQDSGTGFTVAQIEANPAAFFADIHSSRAVPGAVRGQLA